MTDEDILNGLADELPTRQDDNTLVSRLRLGAASTIGEIAKLVRKLNQANPDFECIICLDTGIEPYVFLEYRRIPDKGYVPMFLRPQAN
jgi:hypothetical protein